MAKVTGSFRVQNKFGCVADLGPPSLRPKEKNVSIQVVDCKTDDDAFKNVDLEAALAASDMEWTCKPHGFVAFRALSFFRAASDIPGRLTTIPAGLTYVRNSPPSMRREGSGGEAMNVTEWRHLSGKTHAVIFHTLGISKLVEHLDEKIGAFCWSSTLGKADKTTEKNNLTLEQLQKKRGFGNHY
eukprot:SAG22_NODE_956_length_6320_cov_2.476933_8_plen_184_part_01